MKIIKEILVIIGIVAILTAIIGSVLISCKAQEPPKPVTYKDLCGGDKKQILYNQNQNALCKEMIFMSDKRLKELGLETE